MFSSEGLNQASPWVYDTRYVGMNERRRLPVLDVVATHLLEDVMKQGIVSVVVHSNKGRTVRGRISGGA